LKHARERAWTMFQVPKQNDARGDLRAARSPDPSTVDAHFSDACHVRDADGRFGESVVSSGGTGSDAAARGWIARAKTCQARPWSHCSS
jgi:hypothetical protein